MRDLEATIDSPLKKMPAPFLSKTFLKTISWALVSGAIMATPVLFKTGDFLFSIEVAFWAVLCKTPAYWVHEIIWNGRKPDAIG